MNEHHKVPALPSWHVRFETHDADIAAMYAWVNDRLDALNAVFDIRQAELEDMQDWGPPMERYQAHWEWNLSIAKAMASHGDFTLLRKMFPRVAEFLNPRLLKRRQHRHRAYSLKQRRLRQAIDDVHWIRRIWAQPEPHGYEKWKRSTNDDIQAEAIAAKRHGLKESEVREAMKRGVRGLHGPRYKLPIDPLI
jgi:hypothetical protein